MTIEFDVWWHVWGIGIGIDFKRKIFEVVVGPLGLKIERTKR